jgi:hypothetical protein
MKLKHGLIATVSALCWSAYGQGTSLFIDQKSSDVGVTHEGQSIFSAIVGQSFAPTLSGLGFVNIMLGDGHGGGAGSGSARFFSWSADLPLLFGVDEHPSRFGCTREPIKVGG